MNKDIIGINAVFVADNINTSLFSQYWFIKNGVLAENELLPDSVFAPGLAVVSTNAFQFLVMPNQIQFSMKTSNFEIAKGCITEKLSRFAENLENIRIKAIGLNFAWRIQDSDQSMHDLSKRLFSVQSLSDVFCADDALFGAYFSQNIDDVTRLHLDFKPTNGKVKGRDIDFILASFNYHRDITEQNQKSQLLSQIEKWEKLFNHSNEVLCALR